MSVALGNENSLGRGAAVFLSLLPPGGSDRRLALGLIFVSVVVFVALAPFAQSQITPIPAFIPIYQAALFFSDLITALVLAGQFTIHRTRGLLLLSMAYLFTALIIVPHTLSFPGLFGPPGFMDTGPQTTAWLFMLWHAGFPLMVMGYAATSHDSRPLESPRKALLLAIGSILAAVVALTLLTTTGKALLPTIMLPDNSFALGQHIAIFTVLGLCLAALAQLWLSRPHTTLDLWMMVVMVAWACDVGLSGVLNAHRFDLGFYAGRAYGLVAATFVLAMLLLETRSLYARVARDLVGERDSAERQSRRVFETSQDVILVIDGSGTVVQVSPSSARALGYRPEEMVGRGGGDFILPDDLESARAEMRLARSGNATRNFKCRFVHKDGRVVSLLWTGAWSAGDHRHYLIGRDMTDIESTEDQLRQAQKMEAVGQLTGGVAHDFNNILMVIQANVEELLEDEQLSPDHREMLASIAASADRAAEMTRRLLAFSRKQRLTPQSTNLTDLVASIDKLLRRTLGEQIEIEAVFADDLWTTFIDRSQLEAALVNLSVNARDAMPGGGRLLIETANSELDQDYAAANPGVIPGQYVMLAVSDTGTGIPPDILSKVFEPFFTTKEPGKGTGLGLSMVYGFIKQSNGHIKIYSEVGRGTTIRLYMPRSDAPSVDDRRAAPAMPQGKERVLLVEDEQQVRVAVLRQLRSLGYAVTEAAGGQPALACLEGGARFDLLLTDVIMPGLDGPSLVKVAGERWPAMKVLYMSGYSETAARSHGLIDADARILSKPFRKSDLAARVRETLDG